jgi:hypothetical protein
VYKNPHYSKLLIAATAKAKADAMQNHQGTELSNGPLSAKQCKSATEELLKRITLDAATIAQHKKEKEDPTIQTNLCHSCLRREEVMEGLLQGKKEWFRTRSAPARSCMKQSTYDALFKMYSRSY